MYYIYYFTEPELEKNVNFRWVKRTVSKHPTQHRVNVPYLINPIKNPKQKNVWIYHKSNLKTKVFRTKGWFAKKVGIESRVVKHWRVSQGGRASFTGCEPHTTLQYQFHRLNFRWMNIVFQARNFELALNFIAKFFEVN